MSRNPIEQSLIADDTGRKNDKALSLLLSNSPFRRLLIGQFISSVGDWFIIGVLIPTVLALSGGSALAVAGIMAAKLVPALIVYPYTSVFTEHLNNRRTMIAADLLRALIVLFLLSSKSLPAIYLVVFAMESCSVFFFPARNALVPQLMRPTDDLGLARGILFGATQAGLIFGLLFSGTILAMFEALLRFFISLDFGHVFDALVEALSPILFSAQAGFIINSLTFLLSAIILYQLADDLEPAYRERGTRISIASIKANTTELIEFIKEHSEFRGYILTVLIVLTGAAAVVAVGLEYLSLLNGIPPFADQLTWLTDFRGARHTFFLSFIGIGVVLGSILSSRLEKRFSRLRVFPFAVSGFGFGMLAISLTDSVLFASFSAGFASFCLALILLAVVRYIISEIDDAQKYRVMVVVDPLVRLAILLSLIVVVPFSGALGLIIKRLTLSENLFGLAIVGPRFTLILGSLIILGAAAFAFKALFVSERNKQSAAQEEE